MECRIREKIKQRYSSIKCYFSDIIRIDDFHTEDAPPVTTTDKYKLKTSDVVSTFIIIAIIFLFYRLLLLGSCFLRKFRE